MDFCQQNDVSTLSEFVILSKKVNGNSTKEHHWNLTLEGPFSLIKNTNSLFSL